SCSSQAGLPLSSLKRTARPAGTSAAATMCRPGGPPEPAPGVADVPGRAVADAFAVGPVKAAGPPPLFRARPMTAVIAAATPVNAASPTAPAPPSTSERRCGSGSRRATERIQPSTDGSGQLPD